MGHGWPAGRRFDALDAQALYYVVTGIWPLLHLRSFMALTGPKADTWLVQTFGGLVAALGLALVLRDGGERGALKRVSTAAALALATADVWFVARRRISPIYLADALVELALVATAHRDGQSQTD
jgi:hypothetical protein